MNELRRKVLALLGGSLEREVLADLLIDVISRDVRGKGGRPRKDRNVIIGEVSETVSQTHDLSSSGSESSPSSGGSGSSRQIEEISERDAFDVFWAEYPKRVGKADARRAWARVKPPIEACLLALTWQKRSLQWQQGYIPNPATYINQGRWEDEPPRGPAGGGYSKREIAGMVAAEKFIEGK